MATRSLIGKILPGGGILAIYCHWDGYPENNGEILKNHYQDSEKVDKLISLGNLSSLAPEIGDEPHDFNSPPDGVCNFYGRDRRETRMDPQLSHTLTQFMKRAGKCVAEYVYIFNDGKWGYSRVTSSAESTNFIELK